MSLAMFAAPFNDNSNTDDSNNYLHKKKQAHNKTHKNYPKENFDVEKVNAVLEKIHNNQAPNEDNKDDLGDFNPPPMPESVGVEKTTNTEQMQNMSLQNNNVMFKTLGRSPQPNYDGTDNLDLNDYNNYGNSKTIDEYYKKLLPGYNSNRQPVNKLYYNIQPNNNIQYDQSTQDILLQKLNYMISLLEEQQDEKTNNVTEEVVLYSFLGIFIIFVVDSFARVGKYVR